MDYNLGQGFFEKLDQEQTRAFLKLPKTILQRIMASQILLMRAYTWTSTPHMHLGIVPMRDGKLSSKAMFDREELKKIQDELPQYLNEQGFELERGARNSEAKHLTVAEFKQEIAYKEIEQELVLDFGAPEYANNLGELVTKGISKRLRGFQNELGNLFGGELFSWRETTFQEKLDWVKERQREEVERLAEARKPLEDEIRALNEFLREKYEEVDKIELRASESLSELSEAEGI